MIRRNSVLFLALAFGLSWAIAGLYFAVGGRLDHPFASIVLLAFMAMPAVAAIIVQRLVERAPLADLGLRWRFNRWIFISWLAPVFVMVLAIFTSTLLPGVALQDGSAAIFEMLATADAPAEVVMSVEDVVGQTGAFFPLILAGGLLISGLIAGLTVNALAAFGEELGWRGFLYKEWRHNGFWKSSFVIGVLWGLWHLPIIIQGFNYATHPRQGVGMMVFFAVLLSPLHTLVREKSGTILAPSILHGTINALAGAQAIFLTGGNDLLNGVTGAGGFIGLLIVNGLIWWYLRGQEDVVGISAETTEQLSSIDGSISAEFP